MSETKIKYINKLILVGNGFDLALGLKTKYEDFLLWLLKKQIGDALANKNEQYLPIDKYKGHYNEHFGEYAPRRAYGYNTCKLFDVIINKNYNFPLNKLTESIDVNAVLELSKTFDIEVIPNNSGGLFSKILHMSNKGWVDIEEIYYKFIKIILDTTIRDYNIDYIDVLNEELNEVKKLLKEYLNQLDYSETKKKELTIKYINQFTKDIHIEDIMIPLKENEILKTDELFFLNFNYTSTIFNIVQEGYQLNPNNICNIHGDLSQDDDSIIFGYGDEMDTDYKNIEELNDNRFFDNIKSFKYSVNSNYRDLLRFLNDEYFQVLIYGHSCGLSDRVMLNEIFEHENCKSIKIAYYNKSEFVKKTMDISRHFKSNQLMRKKVVSFNADDKIPQL